MTSLDKLSISGVRAYSPDVEQVIQFFHPLTIIVGSNGSGKTTIIEALRFATTGTAPETSERGKNFVHDPRVRPDLQTGFSHRFFVAHFFAMPHVDLCRSPGVGPCVRQGQTEARLHVNVAQKGRRREVAASDAKGQGKARVQAVRLGSQDQGQCWKCSLVCFTSEFTCTVALSFCPS
jgi:hypothetical protein